MAQITVFAAETALRVETRAAITPKWDGSRFVEIPCPAEAWLEMRTAEDIITIRLNLEQLDQLRIAIAQELQARYDEIAREEATRG